MNWTDEELDQLFSDAADNATVEYNDAYWNDIEKMLPVRKKRKGLLWWMGGAGALVFFGTLLIVQSPFETKSSITTQVSNELSKRSNANLNGNSPSETGIQNVKSGSSREANATISTNKSKETKEILNLQNPNKKKVSKEKVIPTDVLQTKEKSSESASELLDKSLRTAESQGLANPVIAKEVESIKNQPAVEETEGVPTLATIDIFPLYQSGELLPTFYKLKARSPHALYAEVAIGMGQSPILSSENGSGIAKTFGLQFGYTHQKNKFRYSSGLGISLQQFDNVYIKERSQIYGFGSNSVDNHYRFSSILRFEVPLSFAYQMNRHAISAGMNLSFPLVAGLSYTKFIDGNMSIQEKGYTSTEFFKPFGAEAQVGYAYQLGSHWELGAKVQMQLINPIASDRILGKTNMLPLSGQVTLRKTIVFKR